MKNSLKTKTGLMLSVLALIFIPLPASSQENMGSGAKPKAIIEVDWQDLQKCQTDDECMVRPSFIGCCHNMAINKKYNQIIEEKRNILSEELTSPEDATMCSLKECITPHEESLCEHNQCKLFLPTAKLNEVQVKKISDELLIKHHINLDNFYSPRITYDNNQRHWHLFYKARENRSEPLNEPPSTITGYRFWDVNANGYTVAVNDASGIAIFINYYKDQ